MPAPTNHFKRRLRTGDPQIGLWLGLASADVAELAAGCGYDWLVVDGEHGPNGLRDLLGQLRAIGDRSHAVVRVRDDNRAGLKQVLDMGAQTVLVPMVDSGAQAEAIVASVLYAPQGVRGVGAALARASDYNGIADYTTTANDQICLLVQVENRAGLAALDDILAVDGVDGVFIGPADLAADMGHPGQTDAPAVTAAIDDALSRIAAAGKATGILLTNPEQALAMAERGVDFLAVGADSLVLRQGLTDLRGRFG